MYAWLAHLVSKMFGRTAKKNMEKDSESEDSVSNLGKIKYWMIQILAFLGAILVFIYFGLVASSQFDKDPFLFCSIVTICVGTMVYVGLKHPPEDE